MQIYKLLMVAECRLSDLIAGSATEEALQTGLTSTVDFTKCVIFEGLLKLHV